VVQEVEELRPELDIESFGDPRNPGVLEDREIHAGLARTIELVAPGIAKDVGAELRAARRGGTDVYRKGIGGKASGLAVVASGSNDGAVGGGKQFVFK
jgi:hypothetical protein